MAEILFSNSWILIFIFFLHAEFFIYLCYNSNSVIVGSLKTFSFKHFSDNHSLVNINNIYFIFFVISLIFWANKTPEVSYILWLSTPIIYTVNNFFEKIINFKINSNIYLVLPSFLFFLILLTFVHSFLSLFFFIELYGVLYYFFFLTSYNFTIQSLLRYKNGLLMLLWNNFLTTLFLSLGCILLLKSCGTTIFLDFKLITVDCLGILLFMFGLFWKLGLPIFHFFKLEVYKYLIKENIFLFSSLTILINFFIFYIFFSQTIVFSIIYSYNIIFIVVMVCIVILIVNLKSFNILQFIALSGVFTITTILTIFIL